MTQPPNAPRRGPVLDAVRVTLREHAGQLLAEARTTAPAPTTAQYVALRQDTQRIGMQVGFALLAADDHTGGRCRHPRPVRVESVVTGELIARLCPDCDEQLTAPGW